jgi:hypothetical protein
LLGNASGVLDSRRDPEVFYLVPSHI